MNQKSDACDDQQHDEREWIEQKRKIHLEAARWQSMELLRLQHGERQGRAKLRYNPKNLYESCAREEQGNGSDQRLGQTTAQGSIHTKPASGSSGKQPEMQRGCHSFIKSIWSTFNVLRERNSEMMMARPTAASAAATTMTKKTKIWPLT